MRVFVLCLAICLVLASCDYNESTVHTSNEDFWEGTDGLVFDFVDENPPEIIYENTPFDIALEVQNLGAHMLTGYMTLSVEDDYICLLDDNNECSVFSPSQKMPASVEAQIVEYDAAIVQYRNQLQSVTDADEQAQILKNIQSAQKNKQRLQSLVVIENPYKTHYFSLEGKSIFNYEGGSDALSYKAKAKSAGTLSETHDVQIIATACYEYTTQWNQDICIDTDINKMNIFPGACEASDVTLSGQGAPLAITTIESKMLPTGTGYIRPLFIIYIANNGNGRIISKEKIQQACTATGLESRDYNMIFLKEFVLSTQELKYDFNGYDITTGKEIDAGSDGDTITCSPNPLVLQNDGNDYITCILNEQEAEQGMFSVNQAPYTTQISMQFDYGYMLSQSQEVTIKKIP